MRQVNKQISKFSLSPPAKRLSRKRRTDGRTDEPRRQTERQRVTRGERARFFEGRSRFPDLGFQKRSGARRGRPRNAAYPARPNDESSETTVMKTSYTVNLSRRRRRRRRRKGEREREREPSSAPIS